MTAENPETARCPQCSQPVRCILEVNSIGTGITVIEGTACTEPIAEPGSNWRIHVH